LRDKKWEREPQVKGRRIKQQAIRPVADVEDILIIVEKGFVPIVDSDALQH
jgi:hypothetical protein